MLLPSGCRILLSVAASRVSVIGCTIGQRRLREVVKGPVCSVSVEALNSVTREVCSRAFNILTQLTLLLCTA